MIFWIIVIIGGMFHGSYSALVHKTTDLEFFLSFIVCMIIATVVYTYKVYKD